MADIRALAEEIGRREATSDGFRRAAALVERRFRSLGYTVRRQGVPVPKGVSWGVPVPAGSTDNVIAEPDGFDPTADHFIVGAHLDTVPQSPGAVDNASGVAIVMELARLASIAPPRVPVVFVAFGGEEPRAPGDDGHHYGSRAFVRELPASASVRGMISVDRAASAGRLRVCTGGLSPLTLVKSFLVRARALDVPARECTNRTSDHWPFEKAGYTVVRLLGADYDEYHSRLDRIGVVSRTQLARVGRITWETLRAARA